MLNNEKIMKKITNLRDPLFFIIFHYSKKKMTNNDILICWCTSLAGPGWYMAVTTGPGGKQYKRNGSAGWAGGPGRQEGLETFSGSK